MIVAMKLVIMFDYNSLEYNVFSKARPLVRSGGWGYCSRGLLFRGGYCWLLLLYNFGSQSLCFLTASKQNLKRVHDFKIPCVLFGKFIFPLINWLFFCSKIVKCAWVVVH